MLVALGRVIMRLPRMVSAWRWGRRLGRLDGVVRVAWDGGRRRRDLPGHAEQGRRARARRRRLAYGCPVRWRTGNEPGGSKMNGADAKGAQGLFTNVHVFDGVSEKRVENANVLVEDNLIKQISAGTITADGARVIDGGGGTLMPGIMALRS